VFVKGRALPLRAKVRADLYSLGRELLALIFKESQARRVTLELRYTASELRETIRHDGGAIDPNLLRTSGVLERAKRIGARIQIQKGWSGGEAIQIRIPGDIVFESHRSHGESEWRKALGKPRLLKRNQTGV
jgi:signal transduction histidine kinase